MSELIRLRPDRIEWRQIDEELVALDAATSEYLAINRTGTALWPGLVEGATREQLVERLTASFDVTTEQAAHDVDEFVGKLAQQGLLEP